MTFKQAVDDFARENKPFGDYWSMQLAWTSYVDYLNREGIIKDWQRQNWSNPCTPETFKKFNRKYYGVNYVL